MCAGLTPTIASRTVLGAALIAVRRGCNPSEGSGVCEGVVEEVCVSEKASGAMTFEEFAAVEFDHIVAIGLASLRDEDEALDVAQETMARAFQRWEEVSQLDRPGAWSRRVALNLVTDLLRARMRRRRLIERVQARPVEPAEDGEVWDERLWACVAELPRRRRDVMVLHYVLDLPIVEIAEIVESPEGTVKSDLARARESLRTALERER